MAATGTTAGPVTQPTVDGTPPGMAARANQMRRPSPAGFDPSFGKSSVEIAGELGRGAKDGIVDLAADAARLDLLHVPAGLARLARSAWGSGGGLSGLVSVVLEPAREQVAAAADRAAEGDFRGAAAAGVKAIGVAVTTGIAVGELGAAAVDAAGSASGDSVTKPGAAGGNRAGRRFTRAGKRNVWHENEAAHGAPTCVNCGESAVHPAQSQRGVTPPGNEGHVDHIVPESKGGDGAPINGQLLCRTCNLKKGNKYP
jgi:hypothetical protein